LIRDTGEPLMEGLNEITLRDILRVIARLTDAELVQLKSAARKEMERRNLKLNRHNAQAPATVRRMSG
jgi:hypothetical protein